MKPTLHCPCDGQFLQRAFHYEAPPAGETAFDLSSNRYERGYSRCGLCGHWFSENAMDMSGLYGGNYVDNTYGDRMRATFERIMALPLDQSDNSARAVCVIDFARKFLPGVASPRLLDVGSGLAVFPCRMKAAGWRCMALDPDERAARHARDVVGVDSVTGDFMTIDTSALGEFDVITFNKVLEHVEDPVAMLHRVGPLLAPGGFIYFEVPDGEAAAQEGQGREEFFVEHHHVFSLASATTMTARAGFTPVQIEALREPSSKFTVRVFAKR